MNKLCIPDIYVQSIYTINYSKLQKKGIKCLLFDLDNTIVPPNVKKADLKIKEFFNKLEAQGFKVIILSNAPKGRLKPFKEYLNVDTAALSFKPFTFKYKKIMKLYKYKNTEIAAIGDQIFTDIKGANKMDITSILVNNLGTKEFITTRINRLREKILFRKLAKNKIFKKGEYYE